MHIAGVVAFLLGLPLQAPEVFPKSIAQKGRSVLLRPPCGFVSGVQELLVEHNLHDFHIHSLFHSMINSQRTSRLEVFWTNKKATLAGRP